MNKKKYQHLLKGAAIAIVMMGLFLTSSSCSNAAIDKFEPEVTNEANAFEFQVTKAENVSTTLEYSWKNEGVRASIDQSSTTTAGTAAITIFDADNKEVYSKDMTADGTFTSGTGRSGTWKIKIELEDLDGTLNFRAQRLN